MRRFAIAFCAILLVGLLVGGSAHAATKWNYNFVGQGTSYSTTQENWYYGYWGVQGWIHWSSDPVLLGSGYDRQVSSSLMIENDQGINWASAGFTYAPDTPVAFAPYEFSEWLLNGNQYIVFHERRWTPCNAQFVVSSTGSPRGGGYEYYLKTTNGRARYVWLPKPTGCAFAFSEAQNWGDYNKLSTTFFGTNKSGYSSPTYILRLKNIQHNWYDWNTSLPAATTYIKRDDDPPYYYSPHSSYRYYYFGTWNR